MLRDVRIFALKALLTGLRAGTVLFFEPGWLFPERRYLKRNPPDISAN
jgi:hypothetical protein